MHLILLNLVGKGDFYWPGWSLSITGATIKIVSVKYNGFQTLTEIIGVICKM